MKMIQDLEFIPNAFIDSRCVVDKPRVSERSEDPGC